MSKDQLTPAIAVLSESFKEGDFVIDCEGCTACCRGHDGVKLDVEEEVRFDSVKDERGEWRVRNVDGVCVYLGQLFVDEPGMCRHGDPLCPCPDGDVCHYEGENPMPSPAPWGCTIHEDAPRRCQEFDCRAAIIFFNNVGIDELVRTSKLPLDVVTMGRKKLDEFNNVMNLRALSGGGDLSFLMEDNPDAPT